MHAAAGLLVLAAVWVWPLPAASLPPFTAHMTVHVAVVAVAAPLIALGLAGGRLDPVGRWPLVMSPIVASIAELAAVWTWHAPALHGAARDHGWALALEQATFLVAGLWLWSAALGGSARLRHARAPGGVAGLLLTSMHMTLLGALVALADRVLFAHPSGCDPVLRPLHDQQLGGAIMLLVGGASYLAGGVWLVGDLFRGSRSLGGPA